MKINPEVKYLSCEKLTFGILDSGDIYKVLYDGTMLNMYPGSYFDGSMYNIYLKVDNKYTKLIGIDSPSSFAIDGNNIIYRGTFENINYKVIISLANDAWFVKVNVDTTKECNIYYCFDVGLANEGINEAYNCQYIDHNVVEDNGKVSILSKQNQGRPLMLETSSFNKVESYSTDGFQFFKESYKFTNVPESLNQERLDNYNYQYELAYLSLQIKLDKKTNEAIFYHKINDNYQIFPSKKCDEDTIRKLYESVNVSNGALSFTKKEKHLDYNNTIVGQRLNKDEIDHLFKEQRNVQIKDGKLLSLFSENNSYVVFQDFERYSKRPSGMVHIGNGYKKITRSPFAFTSYIYGVFASHIVFGNCDFNALTKESKTPLNILKQKGLRIFIKLDGEYRLLTMPSCYKLTVNSSTWYYKFDDDMIIIKSVVSYDDDKMEIQLSSQSGKEYDYIMTNYLDMGNAVPTISKNNNHISLMFNKDTLAGSKYPNLHYEVDFIDNNVEFVEDDYFDEYPMIATKHHNVKDIKIVISSSYDGKSNNKFDDIKLVEDDYYHKFLNNIGNIRVKGNDTLSNKIDDLTIWYVQNALVHYASPHGLEQFSGAAWGFRDVLQGPLELFITFRSYDIARHILKVCFSRQFEHNHDFPQWFMFDEFKNIQAPDSHGDIIVWPIKALSNYIYSSNDVSILDEVVPYFDFYKGEYSDHKETIFNHLISELKTIENSFVDGYNLPSYGGGDWDDTLQPKDKNKAKSMVSGWTVALLLDGLKALIDVLEDTKYDISYLDSMYSRILADFNTIMIKDGIPAGFVYFHNGKIDYMLHPEDNISFIRYRLLPLTRGMIGNLYSPKKVEQYLNIIDDNLMYSDGVRLMSDAIKYKGGKNDLFIRAETASNFGREIGLLYTHAHIRYCEAMCAIGNNLRAYDGFNKIIPIKIEDYVKNACIRQGNVYFSSSDGMFKNRYDANDNFIKLKDGTISVMSGWRLYSSGPGIFLHQLYNHFIGLSSYKGNILLSPVMPKCMDNLNISLNYKGKDISIKYHLVSDNNEIDYLVIDGKKIDACEIDGSIYKGCGLLVDDKYLNSGSTIEVFTK